MIVLLSSAIAVANIHGGLESTVKLSAVTNRELIGFNKSVTSNTTIPLYAPSSRISSKVTVSEYASSNAGSWVSTLCDIVFSTLSTKHCKVISSLPVLTASVTNNVKLGVSSRI